MARASVGFPWQQKLISPTNRSSPLSTNLTSLSRISHHLQLTTKTRKNTTVIACTAGTVEKTAVSKNTFKIESLTSWLLEQQRDGNIDIELTTVITSISLACKQISSLLQRANISKLTGSQGTINIQGEDQAKLDVIANEVFCNCLRSTGLTGIIASEEEEAPIAVEETYSGNYMVVFDPIDGSSNIDTSLTTGSIFGIYDSSNNYCLADPDEEDDKMSISGELDQMKQKCIADESKRYSARYIGCLVGEIHRTLLYGGIYGNPSNIKSKKGNLRLLYECAPMSYLVEQAGGKGSDGHKRILDIEPEEVHQRVPIFIGSPEEVDKLEKYLA